MIWFYRIAFVPVFLAVFPFYLRRMLKRGGYGRDFMHRLGGMPTLPQKRKGVLRLWIQAVSVGEIQAIEPVLRELHKNPHIEVVLTTTTSTAYKILCEKLTPFLLAGGIFPIDFWLFSRKAWNKINPDLAILMEGELWPEHLYQAQRRNVPAILINGRLSDHSFQRYAKYPRMAKWLFGKLSMVLASSPEDFNRFAEAGVCPDRLSMTGNLKFDVSDQPRLDMEGRMKLRRELGFGDNPNTKVLIGASTWPTEEKMLLEIFRKLSQGNEDWRLLIVPRHAERRAEIVQLLQEQSLPWLQRSQTPSAPAEVKIALADTTGELRSLIQTADMAFIGKSLPPNNGGQTPIEAAVFGIPMVYGPMMSNFRPICASLEGAGAAVRANDADQAQSELLALAADSARRQQLSTASTQWHQANRGATARSLEKISELFPKASG